MLASVSRSLVLMNINISKHIMTLYQFEKQILFNNDGVIRKTSISIELDKFISKSITIILRKHILGWKHILHIPFNYLSSNEKANLLNDIVSAKTFLKDTNEFLTEYLITVDQEAVYFFPILRLLIDESNHQKIELSKKVIQAGFDLCLCNSDLRVKLLPSFTAVLNSLLNMEPLLISYFLSETRSKFEILSGFILPIISDIPFETWIPTLSDIYMLEGMLKDPIDSLKVKLVRLILDNIKWEKMVLLI
jgi:hypothetical protein